VFLAKVFGVVTSPDLVTLSMFCVSAEANVSAGAPCWICCTSVLEPAKLNLTVTPGLAAWKSLPIVVKASVSEAAAKTVRVTCFASELELDPPLSSLSPHAAANTTTMAQATSRSRNLPRRRVIARTAFRVWGRPAMVVKC
jgi:hypothetical protein